MNLPIDPWTIAAVLLLLGVAIWGIRLLKQRVEEQRYQEHMADLEFEATLLSGRDSLVAASAQDAVFLQTPSPAAQTQELPPGFDMPAEESPVIHEPLTINRHSGPQPADVAASGVFSRLQAAGMVRGIEGYIELHGNPKGAAILRLRNGKLALLVPHMESEGFLQHNAKRVDMIIMEGAGGSAFVVRPIEQLLAEGITLS